VCTGTLLFSIKWMIERKENSTPAVITKKNEKNRKAYRPTRSLPAKKYGGAEREVVGDFSYSLKYDRTGKGKWRREPRLPSDPAAPKTRRTGSREYHRFADKRLAWRGAVLWLRPRVLQSDTYCVCVREGGRGKEKEEERGKGKRLINHT